jgi:hypothetical protein
MGMKTSPSNYQIRVKGHFDHTLTDWFAPLRIANEPDGETTLTGPVRDQAELYGILIKLYKLNFTLIAVRRIQATVAHCVSSLPPGPGTR